MPRPFKHIGHPEMKMAVQISVDGVGPRRYQTPDGNIYPSITTCLGILQEEFLAKWRKRVGEQEANRIGRVARERGDVIHWMFEKYLQNMPANEIIAGQNVNNVMLFHQLRPLVDRIDIIHAQETPLYSDFFRLAGRCDTIGEYDGVLSIIDFKGSNKQKEDDKIEHYFMQTSFYAYAYYERTGIKIPQVVILMADELGGRQVYKKCPKDYWKPLMAVRDEWERRENGNNH